MSALKMCVHAESTGADVSVLDHMTVTNLSDQEALDDFLNSFSDDISTRSSLTSGKIYKIQVHWSLH